jgi:catechol 2,3-dioxygenase-like lactoylglutathione lyase family enzyme
LKTLGIWHFSFSVSDLDAAIEFYRDLLGFEVVVRRMVDEALAPALSGYPDARIEIAFLDLPGQPRRAGSHDLELVRYHRPRPDGTARPVAEPGSAHMAIVVEDALAAYEELRAAGVEFVSPPNEITAGGNAGGRICYFHGPGGVTLEMFQPPPSSPPADG